MTPEQVMSRCYEHGQPDYVLAADTIKALLAAQPASPLRAASYDRIANALIDDGYSTFAVKDWIHLLNKSGLVICETTASLPVPPLRGRDYDQIALDAAYQIEALPTDLHEAQKTARIQLIVLDALSSAPPEQSTARKWTGPGYLEQTGYIDPEQPAAYPSAEADEEHADLLRRLAAVPDKEK